MLNDKPENQVYGGFATIIKNKLTIKTEWSIEEYIKKKKLNFILNNAFCARFQHICFCYVRRVSFLALLLARWFDKLDILYNKLIIFSRFFFSQSCWNYVYFIFWFNKLHYSFTQFVFFFWDYFSFFLLSRFFILLRNL